MTSHPRHDDAAAVPRRRFLLKALAAAAGAAWPWRVLPAHADPQGIEPFLGEIMLVSFNFPPRGWAFCNGQLLPINQNQALFSLLGTTYGGDGRVNFALPDLRTRVAIHRGQGPGLGNHTLGESGGGQSHTLTVAELAVHTHVVRVQNSAGTSNAPGSGVVPARNAASIPAWGPSANAVMAAGVVGSAGGSQAHVNMQPYLTLNYVIALQGIFPSF